MGRVSEEGEPGEDVEGACCQFSGLAGSGTSGSAETGAGMVELLCSSSSGRCVPVGTTVDETASVTETRLADMVFSTKSKVTSSGLAGVAGSDISLT